MKRRRQRRSKHLRRRSKLRKPRRQSRRLSLCTGTAAKYLSRNSDIQGPVISGALAPVVCAVSILFNSYKSPLLDPGEPSPALVYRSLRDSIVTRSPCVAVKLQGMAPVLPKPRVPFLLAKLQWDERTQNSELGPPIEQMQPSCRAVRIVAAKTHDTLEESSKRFLIVGIPHRMPKDAVRKWLQTAVKKGVGMKELGHMFVSFLLSNPLCHLLTAERLLQVCEPRLH